MSRSVDFELNLPGLNELMKSAEMQSILKQAGESVAKASGEDYECRVKMASFVALAKIYPTSIHAARSNAKHNTLLKALGATGLRMG